MNVPPEAARRIATDHVVWLTTVTDRGVPAPNPVWFVADGADLVVYTTPRSIKVHNIEQRPHVTLHFNSDFEGGDVVVITGEATVTRGRKASELAAYLAKYQASLGAMAMTVEYFDEHYSTEVRIRPTKVRIPS